MGTHPVAFRLEKNGVPVKYPTRRTAHITAICQISDCSSLRTDNTYIRIRIMTGSYKFQRKPFAVRRPFIIKPAPCIVPCRSIRHLTYFLRLQIEYHQTVAVFDKGNLLPIGRILRISAFHCFRGE